MTNALLNFPGSVSRTSIQYGSRSRNTAYRYYSFTTNNNLSRLFDLSSGQHLLDLGGELRNGAGQLDLAWLDQATFLAIKERMEELAAVDHKGLSLKKLNQLRPPWWMFWK